MSLYTNSNLKSGIGEQHYFRFFALISSLFAISEGLPTVPNTPKEKDILITEIEELNNKYEILRKLKSVSHAVRMHNMIKTNGDYDYFLMSLNLKTGLTKIGTYTKSHLNKAIEQYNILEQEPDTNNVLASAKSIKELREAYPNYFGDVRKFVSIIKEYI